MITDPFEINILVSIYIGCLLSILFGSFLFKKDYYNWSPVIFWILTAWSVFVNLTTPRNLDYTSGSINDMGWHFAAKWTFVMQLGAYLTTGILLIALFSLLVNVIREGIPGTGFSIWMFFVLFTLSPVASAFLGTPGGGFSQRLFYPGLIMTIIWLTVVRPWDNFVAYAKKAGLAYIWGSLIVAVLDPKWALLSGGGSSISKNMLVHFSYRLFGVAGNANGLSPIALCYLLLDFKEPTGNILLRYLFRFAALAVIILTQTKTVWIVSLVCLMALLMYSHSPGKPDDYSDTHNNAMFYRFFVALLVVFPAMGLLGWIVMSLGQAGIAEWLSGRVELWMATIKLWSQNPLFGYGPDIWSGNFKLLNQIKSHSAGGQAHNMFVQTLGMAGLFGLMFLLLFFFSLFKGAWETRNATKGLSLCFFMLIFLRCMTESPLNSKSIDEGMLTNVIAIGVSIMMLKEFRKSIDIPKSPSLDNS